MKSDIREVLGVRQSSAMAPFWNLAPEDPSSTCLITDDGHVLTYAALQRQVNAFKGILDVPGKSLVFVFCNNTLPSLAGYLACLQSRHTALLLPHDMESSLLEPLLAIYQPEFLWSPRPVSDGGYGDTGFGMEGHRMYRLEEAAVRPPIFPDLALLLSTSGSTGNPKLVRLSYANLQANAASIAEYLQLGPDERPITSLPMYYSYGLSVINSHLLAGATLLMTDRKIRTSGFWDFFREQRATSMSGVPYVYQMLHELEFERMNLPSLRTLTQAGGHLDLGLQKHFTRLARQKNFRYFTMYGQTEATARIAYVPAERAEEGLGSIGIPIPGGSLEIVEDELVYRGPNVMLGYAESRDDLAKADEMGGCLFTGDIARRDESGFFHLIGRKKRFIKLMGLRINSDDVERQLTRHFGHRCVVLGTDMHLTVVTVKPGIEEDIIAFIRRTYRIKGSLCSVRVVNEIPALPTGKTDYESLKNGSHLAPVQPRNGPLLYLPARPARGKEPRPLPSRFPASVSDIRRSAGAA